MKLEQLIDNVKEWTDSNNIHIFESEIADGLSIIQWSETKSNDSLTNYLNFIKNINTKFIVLETSKFEYEYSDTEILELIEKLDNDERIEFTKLNNHLRMKKNELIQFSVSVIYDSFLLQFEKVADWVEDWGLFNEYIENYKKEERVGNSFPIEDKIMKHAIRLSKTALFKKAKNKAQREIAASEYFKNLEIDDLTYHWTNSIIEYADSIIKLEIDTDNI